MKDYSPLIRASKKPIPSRSASSLALLISSSEGLNGFGGLSKCSRPPSRYRQKIGRRHLFASYQGRETSRVYGGPTSLQRRCDSMLGLPDLLASKVPGPVVRDWHVARKGGRVYTFHQERQTVEDHHGDNILDWDHLASGHALEVDLALAGPSPNRRSRDSQIGDGLRNRPEPEVAMESTLSCQSVSRKLALKPGGDPLPAALAAGETSTPRVVAATGDTERILGSRRSKSGTRPSRLTVSAERSKRWLSL